MNPERAGRLALALGEKLPGDILASQIDVVVSPAMGGIIIGHEMGRALGMDAMFLERPDGDFRPAPRFRAGAGRQGADGGGRRHHRPFQPRGDRGCRAAKAAK